jgi:hypothetical protein
VDFNQLRLAARLWLPPLSLFAAGILAFQLAQDMGASPMLVGLAPIARFAAFALIIASASWAAWSGCRLWRAALSLGELCHNCGMPTRLCTSPRSSKCFYRCLACDTSRPAAEW